MENKMQGKAGLCTPRRGPSGAEGWSAACYSTSAAATPCKFTQCFPFPLALRSLSPSFVRNSEARHAGKKVSPVHSLSVATLQIKVIIMNVRTLKEILVPFPLLHLPKQSTNPAALQPYLDAETVWDRDRRVPRRHSLLKASFLSRFSSKTPH